MDRSLILDQVTAIFRDVLDDNAIMLTDSTTAADIDDWDSLSHIQLVVAVEKHFALRFTSREIQSWKNVGEMVDSVVAK